MCRRGLHQEELGTLIQKWSMYPEILLQSLWWGRILHNSELLFGIILLPKTNERDPHIRTSDASKQTNVPLFTRTAAFGSAGVFLIFSPLDHHSQGLLCPQHLSICRIRSNGRDSNSKIVTVKHNACMLFWYNFIF